MTEAMTIETDEPRLNRRQIAKINTADKVLKSARLEFETAGYGENHSKRDDKKTKGATIRSIAKGAGVSTGAVFANYEDKEALYVAVYGHKPISPELGRAAMIALRALTLDLAGEGNSKFGIELVDEMAAIDVLRSHADDLLQTAGFPPLAVAFDDEETSAALMRRALQTWAKGPEA